MELRLVDGELMYVKKDGTRANKTVGTLTVLEFYGFPAWGEKATVLSGNPASDRIILVNFSAQSHWGDYLLSNKPKGGVKVPGEDYDYAKSLVDKQPDASVSLSELMAAERKRRMGKVDVTAMMAIKGLAVWDSRQSSGYWTPDYGEFELPEDWMLLPKGDAALTRRVRKGPYWKLLRKEGKDQYAYTKEVGTLAPADAIEDAYAGLGGDEGAEKRLKTKKESVAKREEKLTKDLEETIRRLYPRIPDKDVQQVLSLARTSGRVGRAIKLYIRPADAAQGVLDQVAKLAVWAHVRHTYTDYDEMLHRATGGGSDFFGEFKSSVRAEVRPLIEEKLDSWREAEVENDVDD